MYLRYGKSCCTLQQCHRDKKGKLLDRNVFLRRLVDSLYVRNDIELNRGNFRVKGDTVDISLAYTDHLLRVIFWDDEIDAIEEIDPVSGHRTGSFDEYKYILPIFHDYQREHIESYSSD